MVVSHSHSPATRVYYGGADAKPVKMTIHAGRIDHTKQRYGIFIKLVGFAQHMLLLSRLKAEPFADLYKDEEQLDTNEAAKHEKTKPSVLSSYFDPPFAQCCTKLACNPCLQSSFS